MPNSHQPTFTTMHIIFHVTFPITFRMIFSHNFFQCCKLLLSAPYKVTTLQLPRPIPQGGRRSKYLWCSVVSTWLSLYDDIILLMSADYRSESESGTLAQKCAQELQLAKHWAT